MSKHSRLRTVGIVGLALVTLGLIGKADDRVTTQPSTDQQRMEAWWDDLEKPEPDCSRALLSFSSDPDQAVAFFKNHLKPLKLNVEDARAFIAALGSDEEAIWKPAFEEMEYQDPRLAISLETMMDQVREPTARNRLVAVLCDYPADKYKGRNIELWTFDGGKAHSFTSNEASWWAEDKVSDLNTRFSTYKRKWTRAVKAIILLEHIGTPEAVAILKEMAGGHPDALPTRTAKDSLARLAAAQLPGHQAR